MMIFGQHRKLLILPLLMTFTMLASTSSALAQQQPQGQMVMVKVPTLANIQQTIETERQQHQKRIDDLNAELAAERKKIQEYKEQNAQDLFRMKELQEVTDTLRDPIGVQKEAEVVGIQKGGRLNIFNQVLDEKISQKQRAVVLAKHFRA